MSVTKIHSVKGTLSGKWSESSLDKSELQSHKEMFFCSLIHSKIFALITISEFRIADMFIQCISSLKVRIIKKNSLHLEPKENVKERNIFWNSENDISG